MPVHKAANHSPKTDASLIRLLVGAVVALLAILLVGGYWLQQQRAQNELARQAHIYQSYSQSTRPSSETAELPASFIQAQETRKQLLSHPAVTPGTNFDKPGVQATGKAIVDAIDQAKGL